MITNLNIALILSMFIAFSNIESDKDMNALKTIKHGSCCIPDSNFFSLKHIDRTIDKDDVFVVKQLKNLTREQIKAWIVPIPSKDKYNIENVYKYYKAVSFQKRDKKYFSVLLMMIEDIGIDYVIGQQILVTIDNNGKFISELPVFYLKNLSNSNIQTDSTRGLYQFSTDTRSRFSGDTIKVYQLIGVGRSPRPASNEDTWQELYETIYLVNASGKIDLIQEQKKIGK